MLAFGSFITVFATFFIIFDQYRKYLHARFTITPYNVADIKSSKYLYFHRLVSVLNEKHRNLGVKASVSILVQIFKTYLIILFVDINKYDMYQTLLSGCK